VELTAPRIGANCTNSKTGPKGAIRAAERELGIEHTDAHRAVKVASLSPEAKAAAVDAGLDNNRTALLEAAKEATPEDQVAAIKARSTSSASKTPDVAERKAKQIKNFFKVWASLDGDVQNEVFDKLTVLIAKALA
jgi:hypothetical protein